MPDLHDQKKDLLNTWEAIIAHLDRIEHADSEDERIALLIELLVHLRLIGTDPTIPDLRTRKGDVETIQEAIERRTRQMLAAVSQPSSNFIYFAREVIKKFPVRQDAEEMIERIRADAEAFEESRSSDDPLLGFAGDLRKEVHRRLSPRIITQYLVPYLEMVEHHNPEPMVATGYGAIPYRFKPEEEDPECLDLAKDLYARLTYLWDFEEGDMAAVRNALRSNLEIFERCFLRAEVESLLDVLEPELLENPEHELDALKRLASVKRFLKQSYYEGRIDLYDFVLLDLGMGRLVFLVSNDLTNNHYAEVTPRNLHDALEVLKVLLSISSVKGLAIEQADVFLDELEAFRQSAIPDLVQCKRRLEAISSQVQHYVQESIIGVMNGPLGKALEEYGVPTSKVLTIRTRFFNNFIRRTLIHVLSEFVEKMRLAVAGMLGRQFDESQLYSWCSDAGSRDDESKSAALTRLEPRRGIALTWQPVEPWLRQYLGGKGNSLIDMAQLGLPVPPAFIISHAVFQTHLTEHGAALDESASEAVMHALQELERQCGGRLGDPQNPLLVSVRSGSLASLPGMMATVINVGLTPAVRATLSRRYGPELAETLYLRFLRNCAAAAGVALPSEQLPVRAGDGRETATSGYGTEEQTLEKALLPLLGSEFFIDAKDQLRKAIMLVYNSRSSQAARYYSRTLASTESIETAVTVQKVVFGNLNQQSCSGVILTRNPITGDDSLFGEFKRAAQGEEVVSGSADLRPIEELDSSLVKQLEACSATLRAFYRQELDIEFTVEDGTLYLLQARAARLGTFARLMSELSLLERNIINLDEFAKRLEHIEESSNGNIALPRAEFRFRQWVPPLAVGVPINGGVVTGTLALTPERLQQADRRRETVILFAVNTKPAEVRLLNLSSAIVTVYPGRTSHAAITAMALNKPCIVGCSDIEIDYERKRVLFHGAGGMALAEGERITIDGNSGAIYRGVAPIAETFIRVAAVREAMHDIRDPVEAAVRIRNLVQRKLQALEQERSLRKLGIEHVPALRNQRVLVRVDLNIDGLDSIAERRVALLMPVLRELLERGATPVLLSHRGDPGAQNGMSLSREEVYERYSLRPFAQMLEGMIGAPVEFHETSVGSSGLLISRRDILPGRIHMVENLRFASGETDNDESFAKSLASLGDGLYVNDAFNVCFRRHASIVSLPRFVNLSMAGPMIARELAMLEKLLLAPVRPFVAVFSGEDLEAQYGAMAALRPRVDAMILLHGESENLELRALLGGQELFVTLPIVASPDDERLLHASSFIASARTILWAGSAGLELEKSEQHPGAAYAGTAISFLQHAMREAVEHGGLAVVCSEQEKHLAMDDLPGFHISTGPRAFLLYLERLSLPGITVLSDPA
ncbi:MAG: phosphoglycerate kinase [Spirochaetaceae bacterium]|nr:phosphoglycerate kinase [Spirochaetaceae bacterium]